MDERTGSCPVCNKPFAEGDDVVICPQCGAPYHRTCYNEAGRCVFSDRHGKGFEYKAAPSPQHSDGKAPETDGRNGGGAGPQEAGRQQARRPEADESANTGGILCSNCRTVNDKANIFCEKCGNPLHGSNTAGSGGRAGTPPPFGQGTPPPNANGPLGYGPVYGGQAAAYTGELDGIPKQDWADFIGTSAPVYLPRLEQMKKQKYGVSLMITAFIFPSLYFAYRKLWGWAALGTGFQMLVGLVQTLWRITESGYTVLPWMSQTTLYTLNYVLFYLFLVVRILAGLFALYLYRKNAIKKIGEIREQCDGDALMYRDELRKKGGVSIVGVAVCIGLMFLLAFLIVFLIGQEGTIAFYNSMVAGTPM